MRDAPAAGTGRLPQEPLPFRTPWSKRGRIEDSNESGSFFGFLDFRSADRLVQARCVAIKQTLPGPILFKQRRYGLNGEEILV